MSKHTQGKWEVSTNHLPAADYARNLIMCNGKKVASTMTSRGDKATQEANAILMAASPLMYELLQDILTWDGILPHSKTRINNVLSKATN